VRTLSKYLAQNTLFSSHICTNASAICCADIDGSTRRSILLRLSTTAEKKRNFLNFSVFYRRESNNYVANSDGSLFKRGSNSRSIILAGNYFHYF